MATPESILDTFPRHRQLLERALDYFQTHPRVVGLAVGGSVAIGGAGFYSDIDLDFIAHNTGFDAVFADRDIAAFLETDS